MKDIPTMPEHIIPVHEHEDPFANERSKTPATLFSVYKKIALQVIDALCEDIPDSHAAEALMRDYGITPEELSLLGFVPCRIIYSRAKQEDK